MVCEKAISTSLWGFSSFIFMHRMCICINHQPASWIFCTFLCFFTRQVLADLLVSASVLGALDPRDHTGEEGVTFQERDMWLLQIQG